MFWLKAPKEKKNRKISSCAKTEAFIVEDQS